MRRKLGVAQPPAWLFDKARSVARRNVLRQLVHAHPCRRDKAGIARRFACAICLRAQKIEQLAILSAAQSIALRVLSQDRCKAIIEEHSGSKNPKSPGWARRLHIGHARTFGWRKTQRTASCVIALKIGCTTPAFECVAKRDNCWHI